MKYSNNPLKYFINLENRARHKLIKRYDKPLSYHDVKIINDILYNEKTHYVEQFKEYLIYEDDNEFLKRFYKDKELKIKLPKILCFYEKYSKIYANYTVIPESKYMYKNIKRKQKMIDQMQNNANKDSETDENEESKEEISNTIFSSRVMNSIYCKTITTLNKSDLGGNSEQSINDFLNNINNIENKIKKDCLRNNFVKNSSKYTKSQKEIFIPLKKINKDILSNEYIPKTSRINSNYKKNLNFNNRINGNISHKNKCLDIQFTYSKKNILNEINKNNSNNNTINKNNNINNANLIFINSYVHKNKKTNYNYNYTIYNTTNSITNNSNTIHGHKNSLNSNMSSKHRLPTALLKQSAINSSKNMNNFKENRSITNINNYFSNASNILKGEQKYKLCLYEALMKNDKVIPKNSSVSPKTLNQYLFTSRSKTNIFNNKNQRPIKEKQKRKEYIKQTISSNKVINSKQLKSNILREYNSTGNNLTLSSNKYSKEQKFKNIKNDTQIKNNIQNKDNDNNNINNQLQSNINYKKPESNNNYYHSKVLSGNIINNNSNNNSKKKFKITVGLKHDLKNNSRKILSSHCSPNNSSSNFYFSSNLHSHKNSGNNMDTNIKKTIDEYSKKRVINNYNIVNNIQDNSTQINIFTGNELYNSLHFHNNSVFNSSNLLGPKTNSKSPKGVEEDGIKSNKNDVQGIAFNNNNYLKSHIKRKDNQIKYNLNLKNIINNQATEEEKPIISERQTNNKKLFEKLGKYFFKNENSNINNNNNNVKNNINNNYNNNVNDNNINSNIKNMNNKNFNKHNTIFSNNYSKNVNNDYNTLINKIMTKNNSNNNSNKALRLRTNNNTPIKNKCNPYISKNNKKIHNICLSPQKFKEQKKMSKASSRQNMNSNNIIINNLNDLKNIGLDDGNKLIIHSDRNKNSKIYFK